MSHGRPLLAARSSSGDKDAAAGSVSPSGNRPPGMPATGRAKRTLIESACSACRRRKSRCDGQRPTCSRCQNLRTDCHYEAEEGESRWSALRRRNQVLEAERDQLKELMYYVQTRPEHEAQELFQRIRQTGYDDLFIMLRHMKEGAMPMPQQPGGTPGVPPMTPASSGDQRLPPIQAILDPGRGMPPAQLSHSQSLSSEESRSSTDTGVSGPQPGHRHPLDTLEPSLRGQGRNPPLLSEESSGSIGSSTMNDMQNPYYFTSDQQQQQQQPQQQQQHPAGPNDIYGNSGEYYPRPPG